MEEKTNTESSDERKREGMKWKRTDERSGRWREDVKDGRGTYVQRRRGMDKNWRKGNGEAFKRKVLSERE